jgi:hypothetical protein
LRPIPKQPHVHPFLLPESLYPLPFHSIC